MKKKILIALLSVLPLISFADNAPTAAAAAPQFRTMKIGVVDVRAVIQESVQLQQINTRLTQKYKPREQAIISAQAKFKEEEDRYNKDGATMSEAARTKLQNSLIFDRANLQAMITSFQQDLDNEQNGDMQKLLSQVASIVNEIAKAQHYDLILQADSAPYVSEELNITKEVLHNLNSHV